MMMKTLFVIISFTCLIFACKSDSISESDKKEIINQLKEIHDLDQQFAGLPPEELIEKHGHVKGWEIFEKQTDSVGLINQNKIKKLFKKYGYLGYKEVGEEASTDFWISIQHADNDVAFQQEILAELKKEILNNNANKAHFAYLEDRVNVNLHKKQRFGTQVTYNSFGQAYAKNGLVDSVNVDNFRKEYNLPTLYEYYNGKTTSHFHMNREIMLKKKILEPRLYK